MILFIEKYDHSQSLMFFRIYYLYLAEADRNSVTLDKADFMYFVRAGISLN